jgi:osmotically-inducible protein OsmY
MKLTLSRQRSWFAAAVGLAATVAVPAAAHPPDKPAVQANLAAEGAQPADPDEVIVAQIRDTFGQDNQLRRVRISVGSENGVVTLAGTAPNLTVRDRAEQYARETPGVSRVDNFIQLDISSPSAPARNLAPTPETAPRR